MSPVLGDISPFQLMAWPFAECLVLVGIHSYLGLHVIRRQVIFVDLSLAQIAALGTTVAFWAGIQRHSFGAFLFSLSFTFLGAAVFAVTRTRKQRVPQEAIIGLVYALAAALVVLVIDRAPHGAEHIKDTMSGTLLYVRPWEVGRAALAYAAVGAFHYLFRHKFMAITEDPEKAAASGINVHLWDFLFYLSFGFVITFSVETAGVLLVFIFLVVPAVIAVSITSDWTKQLLIGWAMGTLVTVLGLTLSYRYDTPSGPTVVAFYGLVLLAMALVLYVIRSENRYRALRNLGLGTLAVLAALGYFIGLKKLLDAYPRLKSTELLARREGAHHHHHGHHAAETTHHHQPRTAAQRFEELDLDEQEQAVAKMRDPEVLARWFQQAKSADARLSIAQRMADLAPRRGALLLLQVLDSQAPPYHRGQALDRLSRICGQAFRVDFLEADPKAIRATLDRVRACVSRLDPGTGRGARPATPRSRPHGSIPSIPSGHPPARHHAHMGPAG